MAEKIKVSGIAVKPQVSRNGIKYTAEELAKFAPSMKGKPILKDHEALTDNVIGVVMSALCDKKGKVVYEGWVKEDGTNLIEKIRDGRIKEVSIGAMVGKLVESEVNSEKERGVLVAVDMEAMELSTTPTPGNRGTSLKYALENTKNGKVVRPVCERLVLEDVEEQEEENIMAEDEVKTPIEEPKEDVQTTKEPKEEVKEQPIKEPKEEEKSEGVQEEEKEEEPKKAQESVVKLNVDSSEFDNAIAKAKELVELQNQLKKENKEQEVKEEIKMTEENTLKGKVVKDNEVKEEKTTKYVLENSEVGRGSSLWKMPNEQGRYD